MSVNAPQTPVQPTQPTQRYNNYQEGPLETPAPTPAEAPPETPTVPEDTAEVDTGAPAATQDELPAEAPGATGNAEMYEEPSAPDDNALLDSVYQDNLNRTPDDEGRATYGAMASEMRNAGKSDDEIRTRITEEVRGSQEYKDRSTVNSVFQEHLTRDADEDGMQKYMGMMAEQRAQGASEEDVRKAMGADVQNSEEYKALHPEPEGVRQDHENLMIRQPNGWTCGPTSLKMALTAAGAEGADKSVMDLANEAGANPGVGYPGGTSLIADQARRNGADANYVADDSPASVRAELEKGRGVVVNGTYAGYGHFAYVAGVAEDGRFIVNDPARGTIKMTDAELNHFMHSGPHPSGIASIGPKK